ncbi:AAA family ATPase [Defluviimonas aestuarii]|uniref:Lon protease family protein n=1 Tax=Albidovulum aestuarii TaxID=1130726 RepID=UPI00249B6135|nr:AAA family ATPase [Defluviimonas aestuarii]MDI3338085.1 AAA family ATPase [Defluviimonas aestuarii]
MAKTLGPEPLPAAKLSAQVKAEDFTFTTSAELRESGWIGQDRALGAIRMAAEMRHGDFNAFVLGNPGSGRRRMTRAILSEAAMNRPRPADWVYVNNFGAPHKPVAIKLPAGMGTAFRKAMEDLIDELANDIPALFDSEDYQTRRRGIEQSYSEEHEAEMSKVFEQARARDVAILRTPMGFTVVGTRDGEVMTPEKRRSLSDDEQAAIDAAVDETEQELAAALKAVPGREKQHRREVEDLNYAMATGGVDVAIRTLREAFSGIRAVQDYLDAVRGDLIENAEIFLVREDGAEAGPFPVATTRHYAKPRFQRYTVNVIVAQDGDGATGAPVIEEELPTLANLIGRIEFASEMGALVTNFTMIKPGALHRANGGFLILDARQVLSEPLAWDALKRCLRTREIAIYSPAERFSLISTVSLAPDPVPLDLRVIMVGERIFYYLLAALDPDFTQLFKLEADFNDHIAVSADGPAAYAAMIAGIARDGGLRPLDPPAMAWVFHESHRMTDDAGRLSLGLDHLSDLLREADFWAGAEGRDVIGAGAVEKAVSEREFRAGRLRELGADAILRETLMIDTDGARVGQINALSVLEIGGTRFGRPSRLTARTRLGTGKVVDIERETELGGPIHSKGMLILQGYLAAAYATDAPMSLWASLVFEQSYGGVDGDSASAAELLALISSLSDTPIDQSLAITGSVNQFGDIQAIGGVNEKIEGFFDICAARGLTGRQGVLIPAANVKHLSLRLRVIEAVEAGQFRILPMRSIADGIEALTGFVAGERGEDGVYPEGSVNRRTEDRLRAFAEKRKAFGRLGKEAKADV